MICRHNRCRQDDLTLERKYQTQDWSIRVSRSLLGIVIVDSWLLYTGARGPLLSMNLRLFYETLALELFDSDFDPVGLRAHTGGSVLLCETRTRVPNLTSITSCSYDRFPSSITRRCVCFTSLQAKIK
jgi:hypothetical protein